MRRIAWGARRSEARQCAPQVWPGARASGGVRLAVPHVCPVGGARRTPQSASLSNVSRVSYPPMAARSDRRREWKTLVRAVQDFRSPLEVEAAGDLERAVSEFEVDQVSYFYLIFFGLFPALLSSSLSPHLSCSDIEENLRRGCPIFLFFSCSLFRLIFSFYFSSSLLYSFCFFYFYYIFFSL